MSTSRIGWFLLALRLGRRHCRLNLPTFRACSYIRKILRGGCAKIPDWGLGLSCQNNRLNENRLHIHCRWRAKCVGVGSWIARISPPSAPRCIPSTAPATVSVRATIPVASSKSWSVGRSITRTIRNWAIPISARNADSDIPTTCSGGCR